MPRPLDLKGKRFGLLVARYRVGVEPGRNRNSLWYCECDCGGGVVVKSGALTGGNTSSCGCHRAAQSQLNASFQPRRANGRFRTR